jgi:hypothetical protein
VFDSSLFKQVTYGIIDTLYLRSTFGASPGGIVTIMLVTSPCTTSTVTWNTQPSFDSLNSKFTFTPPSSDGYSKIVSDTLNNWITKRSNGSLPNYGFMIRYATESSGNTWLFYTEKAVLGKKPYISIGFTGGTTIIDTGERAGRFDPITGRPRRKL